jgi:NADH dehydrogenase
MVKKHLRVVIVGGGFGGIKLARELAGQAGISITLISDQLNFRYSPALYRTATGHRNKESSVPLKTLVADIPNLRLVHARAEHIDRTKRVITTGGGTKFEYDYAVLALGVATSFFGIEGLERYAYGIKSADEVDRLRAHLHQELVSNNALEKNYVVVGAGPTGVELAGALRYYLTRMAKRHNLKRNKVHIELIEAADRVLPAASLKASRLAARRLRRLGVKVQTNCRVLKETDSTLMAGDRSIPTHTVVWTAGVTNNPFFAANAKQFILNEHKKVVVDGYLRVDERTFVIGDNAATPYSGLALTAIHNASYVAKYLSRTLHNKTISAYHPFQPLSAVPIGPGWSVAQWGNYTIGGFMASILRLFADLIGYMDIMGLKRVVKLWLRRYEYEETCPVCQALTLHDLVND